MSPANPVETIQDREMNNENGGGAAAAENPGNEPPSGENLDRVGNLPEIGSRRASLDVPNGSAPNLVKVRTTKMLILSQHV